MIPGTGAPNQTPQHSFWACTIAREIRRPEPQLSTNPQAQFRAERAGPRLGVWQGLGFCSLGSKNSWPPSRTLAGSPTGSQLPISRPCQHRLPIKYVNSGLDLGLLLSLRCLCSTALQLEWACGVGGERAGGLHAGMSLPDAAGECPQSRRGISPGVMNCAQQSFSGDIGCLRLPHHVAGRPSGRGHPAPGCTRTFHAHEREVTVTSARC